MKSLIIMVGVALCFSAQASMSGTMSKDATRLLNLASHCLPEYEQAMKLGEATGEVHVICPQTIDPDYHLCAYMIDIKPQQEGRIVFFRISEATDRRTVKEGVMSYYCKVFDLEREKHEPERN